MWFWVRPWRWAEVGAGSEGGQGHALEYLAFFARLIDRMTDGLMVEQNY